MKTRPITKLLRKVTAPTSHDYVVKQAQLSGVTSETASTVKLDGPGRAKYAVGGFKFDLTPALVRSISLSDLPGKRFTES